VDGASSGLRHATVVPDALGAIESRRHAANDRVVAVEGDDRSVKSSVARYRRPNTPRRCIDGEHKRSAISF
jgi:hypothetical protein